MWKQIWPIIIHEKHKKILGNFSLFRLHSEPFQDFNEYGMKNVETSGMNKLVERSNAGKNSPPSRRKYKFLESVIVSKGLNPFDVSLADADSFVFRGSVWSIKQFVL